MKKVAVLTDSISGIPEELIKEYNIKIIPAIMTINGKNYRDMVDINPDQFWKLFKSIRTYVTASPSPGEFMNFFQEAGRTSDDIIFISASRQLSAIYQSASSAREMLRAENPGLNIEVIDSKHAAGSMGFIVIEAARAAAAGKTASEVIQAVQNMIGRVKSICGMDTLKYLIRSGRAPKKAYIGELLGVKPLIGMVSGNGLTDSLGTIRGKKRCFQRLIDMIAEYTDTSMPLHVIVQYTNSLQDGQKLAQMIKDRYNCAELYIIPYSPVISGHSGPINSISFYSQVLQE